MFLEEPMSLTLPVEELTRSRISVSLSGSGGFPFFKMTPLPDASPVVVQGNLRISFHVSSDSDGYSVSASISSDYPQASSSSSSRTSLPHERFSTSTHDDRHIPSSVESGNSSIPTDTMMADNSESYPSQDYLFSTLGLYPSHDVMTSFPFDGSLTYGS
ncbi:hypothetical protein SERLA73DRAFT_176603, partial [Serpula lacrymans var. lacrymans S7.3]